MFIELSVFILMGLWCVYTMRATHFVVAACSLFFFIIDWKILPETFIGQDPVYWALFWSAAYLALFSVLIKTIRAPFFRYKLLYTGIMLIVFINSFYGLSWYVDYNLYNLLDPVVLPVVNFALLLQIIGFFTGGRYARNGDRNRRSTDDDSVSNGTFSAYTGVNQGAKRL